MRNRSALLAPRHVAHAFCSVRAARFVACFSTKDTQKSPQKPTVQVWNWLWKWEFSPSSYLYVRCRIVKFLLTTPISPGATPRPNAPFELSSSFLAECGICIVPKLLCHCAAVSFLFTSPPTPPTMETAHCANHVYCANHATLRDRRRAREPISCARAHSQTGFPSGYRWTRNGRTHTRQHTHTYKTRMYVRKSKILNSFQTSTVWRGLDRDLDGCDMVFGLVCWTWRLVCLVQMSPPSIHSTSKQQFYPS